MFRTLTLAYSRAPRDSETVKDREAWHTAAHGVTKSWTRLNNNNSRVKAITKLILYKMLSISCNLLNPVLKVKKKTQTFCRYRMVVSVLVIFHCDCGADWELWVAAVPQHHQRVWYSISLAWAKIRIQVWFLLNVFCSCTIVKWENPKSNNHKSWSVCICRKLSETIWNWVWSIRVSKWDCHVEFFLTL